MYIAIIAFTTILSGAGMYALNVSMSAGGPYAELIYDDRTLIGAAEIRNGQWATWDLSWPGPFMQIRIVRPSGFDEELIR